MNSNNKKIAIESLKAFGLGAVIGYIIKLVSGSSSFKMPIILGVIFLSIHARNNSYKKEEK